jgi:GTP pyrophosphokinase
LTFLAEINVINDDGSHIAAVFEVGGGQDGALLAEKLGSLHILDVTAENHAVVRTDDEFAVADIEAAVTSDDELGITLALCKISDIKLKASKEQASDFRDMIVSYSEDPRVILIKLADRLEVMRSLDLFPEKKRRTKSWESLNLYAQIAHKLGLYSIKSELEDLSLKYLETETYNHIVHELKDS